uniref:Acyltransferase C-terminal domain-containing protein n=1 Tax=Ascaris lumbricoides TaxID=6252 RepID=A0A9J2PCF3_ASCLU
MLRSDLLPQHATPPISFKGGNERSRPGGDILLKWIFAETRPPIKYILDVTIAYPCAMPLSLATLSLGTREKCDIAVNYKIYDASEVPFHDDDKLRDWMYKVYKEKDDMLGTNFILVILAIVPDWFKGRTVMLLTSFVHEGKVFSVIKTIETYYTEGVFVRGEQGTRVHFSWWKIIGQYAFWFTSLYVQYRFYSYLLIQPFRLLGFVA